MCGRARRAVCACACPDRPECLPSALYGAFLGFLPVGESE